MSSDFEDLLKRRNDPAYRNWLAVGNALLLLGDCIGKYAEKKLLELHALITAKVGPGVICRCSFIPGRKANPHKGKVTACPWAQELKNFHIFSRKDNIPWHQSNSSQWHDPVHGYWEIAKLFMSELGKNTTTTIDPNTTDCAALLGLLINCKHSKIQNAALKAVRDWRNAWAHAPHQTLSETDKLDAFSAIDALINDPELVGISEVQACRPLIKETEKADLASLRNDEVTIIKEYTRVQESQNVGRKLDELKQEIRAQKEEKLEITEQKIRDAIKDDVMSNVKKTIASIFFAVLFVSTASPVQHKLSRVLWSLMAFFMFSQVGDRSLISDYGCPNAVIKSPISHFHFQEFDFSAYLAYKREGFVGRKWFFFEIEMIFEDHRIAGVLVTGEPGSGKSALMSQLICSPYSSLLIHENIIGYHLCEYSEKGKRNGARFVRNLVDQISSRMPEYAKHVKNNERIRVELDTRCHKDPTECFFSTIVGPLRNLKPPNSPQFIIIDALDECLESDTQTSEIIDILKNKIPYFPKWLKVILTSRNLTAVTSRLPPMQINRTSLFAADERNINDIQYYVSRFVSQNSHFSDRLLTAMKIHSGIQDMKIFLDEVINRSEGNFLFVKTTLQYINDTGGKINLKSLPTSLFDLYNIFFERQFGVGGFGPFRYFFEVLLAVYSPLHSQEVEDILRSEYEATDFNKRIGQVSCFLRFGRDGTLRIYHQSFSEWLKSQANVLSINQTRGHQSIARFSLRRMSHRKENITFAELTELFIHILSGGSLEMQETALNLFNITEMRDPQTNQCILHYLVKKPNIYLPVLDFFLRKFQTVDVLDASNKTPAFYAASEGHVRSLQRCIDNGANINSFLEGYRELDPVTVALRNTGIDEFSLLHVAVAKSHKGVVELLLKSNVTFPVFAKYYPAPLHLAAANGNLELVKSFYEFGENFDQVALHHAAAMNHLAVVRFILSKVGLRDTCIKCQHNNISQLSGKPIHEIHAFFCETALHAAASRGLVDMVQMLLDFGKEPLECRHHSGKTVLMDAVERNNTEMVDLLLRHGANATEVCGLKTPKDGINQVCSVFLKYKHDFLYTVYCTNDSCRCGYSALHMSARYGLWRMAEKFIYYGQMENMRDLEDCEGSRASRVAIIYNQKEFLQNYNMSLGQIGWYLNDIVVVTLAVKYCSANTAKLFLHFPADEDENVWNLLLLLVMWSPYGKFEITPCHCLKAFDYSKLVAIEQIKRESKRRLKMLKVLMEAYQDKLSVLYKKKDERTLLHYASFYGFTDAVKYLVDLGASALFRDKNGHTALMIALEESTFYNYRESYRCYTTHDGLFSSCTTTCYDETVSYLIRSQRASISKCDHNSALILETVVKKQMPLSLYALLNIGVDWNCRLNSSYSSAMLLHFRINVWEVTEVVKMFEIDVSVKCGISLSNSELHQIAYYSTPNEFGNFFKPSLNRKRFPLQRLIDRHPKGVRILNECYDAEGELPLHYAIRGGNLDAIKWLKNIGANTLLKTRHGYTAIEISIFCLGNNKCARIYSNMVKELVPTNAKYRVECFEEVLRAFFESSKKNYSSNFSSVSFDSDLYSILPILSMASELGEANVVKIVYEKALAIIPSLKRNKFLILDEQDAYGNTPLHNAASHGFENVVKYLVQIGADINIKNKKNNTPLLTALLFTPLTIKSDMDNRCYSTNDGLFTSCKTTPYDEIVRYLISSQKSKISRCDEETAYILHLLILKRMPLSLYALLNSGVDINCQLKSESSSNFLRHMKNGGQEVSEVLKIFEVNVLVQCDIPSTLSELHYISYVPDTGNFGNFFTPSQDGKQSPLKRLLVHHPRGARILNECYDDEGYLPIHMAAKGGNFEALKWFQREGANMHSKTRNGLTALYISILNLGKTDYEVISRKPKYRRRIFKFLLRTFFGANPESKLLCGSSLDGLSLLHIAAVKGMSVLKYVHKEASKFLPNLPINCINKHGLDPIFLAHFYESVLNEGIVEKSRFGITYDIYINNIFEFLKSSNQEDKSVDEIWKQAKPHEVKKRKSNMNLDLGGDNVPSAQYPDREIMNIIVFNYLYRPTDTEMNRHFHSEDNLLTDCPGYYEPLPKHRDEEFKQDIPDLSKCSEIRDDFHKLLCILEVKSILVRCHQERIILELLLIPRRRRGRQLSSFILKVLGWTDSYREDNIAHHWPFYFLHKMLQKKYEEYRYITVLNEALEFTSIRFALLK